MSFHLTTCCCVYFPLVIHHWLAPVILLILSHFSNESKTKDIICCHSTSTPAPVVCGALGQSSPPCHTSKGGKWKVLHTHTHTVSRCVFVVVRVDMDTREFKTQTGCSLSAVFSRKQRGLFRVETNSGRTLVWHRVRLTCVVRITPQ